MFKIFRYELEMKEENDGNPSLKVHLIKSLKYFTLNFRSAKGEFEKH